MVKADPAVARSFAEERHGDQLYGDGAPYSKHLAEVVGVLERYGFGNDAELVCAAWLHDVVEDTDTSIEEIESQFGPRVRELVWAVTNAPGKNRKERARKTYPKIRSTPDALTLKLADRIANVEASKRDRRDLLQMYRKEWMSFSSSLRECGGPEPMWTHLESLLSG